MLRTLLITLVIVFLANSAQPLLVKDDSSQVYAAEASYTGGLAFAPESDPISQSIRAALDLSRPGAVGPANPGGLGSQLGGLRPNPLQPLTPTAQSVNPWASPSNQDKILAASQKRYGLPSRASGRTEPLPEERLVMAIASFAKRTFKALSSITHSLLPWGPGQGEANPRPAPVGQPGTNQGNINRAPVRTEPPYVPLPAEIFAGPAFPRPTIPKQTNSPGSLPLVEPVDSRVIGPGIDLPLPAPDVACVFEVGGSEDPPDVGEDSVDQAKFEDAYCRNLSVEIIGIPDDEVLTADGVEYQIFESGGAILFRPGEALAFYLPSYIWPVYDASLLALGAPVTDIEPDGPLASYADGSSDFTGEPYQRFEAGFIGREGAGPYTANRYYPRIHGVDVTSIASGGDWQLQIDVLVDPSPAYANPISATDPAVSIQMWREDDTALLPEALTLVGGAAPDLHYRGTIPVGLPEDESVSFNIFATRDSADDGRTGYFPCDGPAGGRAYHAVETSGSPISIGGGCPALLALGAQVDDIEPDGPPPFYADSSSDFTSKPYQRYDAGFISWNSAGEPYTANRYYPRIHGVEATSIASGSDWQLQIDVLVDPSPAYANPIPAIDPTVSIQIWREDNSVQSPVALTLVGGVAPDLHYRGTIPVDLPEGERVSFTIFATRDVDDDGRTGYFPCDGLAGGRAFHLEETLGLPIPVGGGCPAPGEAAFTDIVDPEIPGWGVNLLSTDDIEGSWLVDVGIKAYPSDNVGIAQVTVEFNGRPIPLELSGSRYEGAVGVMAGSTNRYLVRVADRAGNRAVWPLSGIPFILTSPLSARLGFEYTLETDFAQTDTQTSTVDGNFPHKTLDLIVHGVGKGEIRLSRNLNTTDTRVGRFGRGWFSLLDASLTKVDEPFKGVQIFYPDGRAANFKETGTGPPVTYEAASAWIHDRLVKDGDDFVVTRKDLVVLRFDKDGKLQSLGDLNGNVAALTYTDGKPTRVTAAGGRFIDITYTGARITRITAPEGKVLDYGYDAGSELLTTFIDAKGGTTSYAYDSDKRLTQITSPVGNPTTRLTYHSNGRVKTHTDGADKTLTFLYQDRADKTGRRRVTDPLGNITEYEYDNKGRLAMVTDHLVGIRSFTYDADYNLLTKSDQLGRVTAYTYDSRGNRLTEDGPLGLHREWAYNSLDQVTRLQEADGTVTTFTYDSKGNLHTATNALGGTSTIGYDALGQPIGIIDFGGRTTSNTFNSFGDLVAITDPLGNTRSYGYDALGRGTVRIEPDGAPYAYTYDGNDNLVGTDGPVGYTERYTYDSNDNLIGELDAEGRLTGHIYDPSDRVVATGDPVGGLSTVAYNAMDVVTSATDPEGRVTTVVVDPLLRKIAVHNTATIITYYSYDSVGNLTSVILPSGQRVTYQFDDLNRMVRQVINDTGGPQTVDTNVATDFEYDLMNRPTLVRDPLLHVTRYGYDALGRLVVETDPALNITGYVYDGGGNITTITDRLGGNILLGYDVGNRLSNVTDQEGNTTTYTYDAMGRRTSQVNPLGVETELGYDLLGRLVLQRDNPGAGPPADTNVLTFFAYDRVGNMLSQTDPLVNTTAYDYDNLNRLIAATAPNGAVVSYEYDGVGNLLSTTDPLGGTSNFTYDGLNRATSIADAAGNVSTLLYGATPNPIFKTDPRGIVTLFDYDGLDRLVARTDNYASGGPWDDRTNVTTGVAYDPVGNILAVTDPNGHATSYTYDVLNRPVSEADALGNTTAFAYDALSNVLQLTNPQSFTTSFGYDGLGRMVRNTDAMGNLTTYEYDGAGRPALVTDPGGMKTQFAYDALSRLTAQVTNYVPAGPPAADTNNTTTVAYDAAGNRLNITDANGYATVFAYDALGRPVSRLDPEGGNTTILYDLAGNVTQVTNPRGGTTSFQYDSLSRLTSATDAAGNSTNYAYDAVGNITDLTDREGRVGRKVYDPLNRVVEEIANFNSLLPADHETNVAQLFGHDAASNVTSITDPRGFVSTIEYDAINRPLRLMNPLGALTDFIYDEVGNVVSVTDPNGHTTNLVYDALSRATSVTDPRGRTVSSVLDWRGDLLSATDPRGNTSNVQYDALYRITSRIDPLGNTTQFEYDALGNILAQTDANGNATTFAYDGMNRPLSITDPEGHFNAIAYDAGGNVTSVTDPNGNTTALVYDLLDRLELQTDPLGSITRFEYDRVGNQVTKVDPLGIAIRYEYDPLYRLTAVIQNFVSGGPEGADQNVDTRYTYDATDNLTGIVDPRDKITTLEYDAIGQLVAEINPLGNRWDFTYDLAANLTQRRTPNDGGGPGAIYEYFADNQLKKIVYPTGKLVEYAYDGNNNLSSITESLGTTEQVFDELNRLASVTDALGRTLGYAYDPVGNMTEVTYPDTSTMTYDYYPDGQMASVAAPRGGVTTASYDPANNLVQMDYPNGTVATMAYDGAGRVVSLANNNIKGKNIISYAYSYDSVSNVTDIVETRNDGEGANALTRNFNYDNLYRLTSVEQNDLYSARYAYDRAGNRTSAQIGKDALVYEYNGANQLLSLSRGSDTVSYAYDANGSRVSRSDAKHNMTQTYTYDEADRLASVQVWNVPKKGEPTPKQQVAMDTDALGRTLRRTYQVAAPSPSTRTQETLWDGVVPVADYNIGHDTQTKYVRGMGDRILGEETTQGTTTQVTVNHQDRQNSIVARTNEKGAATSRTDYDEFGRVRPVKGYDRPGTASGKPGSPTGAGTGPMTTMSYTGQPYDAYTNMYHFFARAYDPEVGQWISQDPARGSLLAPVTMQRYAYAGNNPIRYADQYGFGFFKKAFRSFKRAFKAIAVAVKSAVKAVVQAVTSVVEAVASVIKKITKGIVSIMKAALGAINAFIEAVVDVVKRVAAAVANLAQRVIREVRTLAEGIANAVRHAVAAVKAAIIAVARVVTVVVRTVMEVVDQVVAAVRGFAKAVVHAAKVVARAFKAVADFAIGVVKAVAAVAARVAHQVIAGVAQVARLVIRSVVRIGKTVLDLATTVARGIVKIVHSVARQIKGAVRAVLNVAQTLVKGMLDVARQVVDSVIDIARTSVRLVMDNLSALKDLVRGTLYRLRNLAEAAVSAVRGIAHTIQEGVMKLAGPLISMVREIVDTVVTVASALRDGLKTIITDVSETLIGVARGLVDTFIGMAREVQMLARQVTESFIATVRNLTQTVVDMAMEYRDLATNIVNKYINAAKALVGGIQGIIMEARRGIQLVQDNLSRALDTVAAAVVRAVYTATSVAGYLVTRAARLVGRAVAFIDASGPDFLVGLLLGTGAIGIPFLISRVGTVATQFAGFRQGIDRRLPRRSEELLESLGVGF